ncbi:flagellar hook-associated protein 3 [Alteromonas aestuariivivens]|uniref:Flagellar hook-associated protein 3 n=1 Tax=Alteromonas aestuariivivens TaxID=1938339 RepID=A0A3D8M5K6_9ALTE|nr:flagellar hook-associated protein FlgL [Alteromonas aestuariivivens]RDV25033.1 flagellar hook-associated protein 3 [Alteromonas aestuariivivens]
MRVTTNQIYDQNIRAIMDNQKGMSDTQLALSTGKKLNKPSDDPVGAAQVIRLTEELDKITQYQRNNNMLTNALEQQETVLANITNSVNKARTLVVQAGSGVLSPSDRNALAVEIEQIRDEVLDLMNTKDSDGNFIFAGFQSQSQAFSFNPAATGNAITFVGDSGSNQLQLSDSVTLKGTSSGQQVFEDVFARFNFSITGSTGATVGSASISAQGTFDTFHKNNYDGLTSANNDFQITILGTGQAQLTNVGTGAVVDTVDFTSGQPFTMQGMTFTINGTAGDSVDFSLDTPEKQNIAQTLHEIFLALSDENISQADYQSALDDALVGMDNALQKNSLERSSIGSRLNAAESIYETNLDLEIAAKDARSAIEDTDYAEASAQFARQEAALSAALATFPKISNLSLFNYL